MNTVVVYESHFGNTERLARNIAAACSAFGSARAVHVDPDHPLDWAGVDVLIVASPTQGFRQMPAMHVFLESLPREVLAHLSVACFDTRVHMPWPLNGSAANSMARQLRQKGVHLLVPPEGFFVQGVKGTQGAVILEGEEERATQWAVGIHERYLATHPQAALR